MGFKALLQLANFTLGPAPIVDLLSPCRREGRGNVIMPVHFLVSVEFLVPVFDTSFGILGLA